MAKSVSTVPVAASKRNWSEFAVPILALLGVGISGYLTYVKLSNTTAVCLGLGECETVQNSPYAVIFGIPIALLGLLAYVTILGLWWWGRNPERANSELTPVGIFGISLFGFLYSAYLTYLEFFVIEAICPWCIASFLVMTAIMIISGVQSYRELS
jgi:uncharacterized membrane protein